MSVPIRDNVEAAKSISVSCCDKGHIYFRLHDADGAVFAHAALDKPLASHIIDRLFDALDGVNSSKCEMRNG